MEKERDTFDDLFRSKLQDFEVDTMPGDWEAIADRLPVKAPVPFRRTLRYWAAAAVVSLLMITSGVYLFKSEKEATPLAEKIEQENRDVTGKRDGSVCYSGTACRGKNYCITGCSSATAGDAGNI